MSTKHTTFKSPWNIIEISLLWQRYRLPTGFGWFQSKDKYCSTKKVAQSVMCLAMFSHRSDYLRTPTSYSTASPGRVEWQGEVYTDIRTVYALSIDSIAVLRWFKINHWILDLFVSRHQDINPILLQRQASPLRNFMKPKECCHLLDSRKGGCVFDSWASCTAPWKLLIFGRSTGSSENAIS